jgi:hypothetical protein
MRLGQLLMTKTILFFVLAVAVAAGPNSPAIGVEAAAWPPRDPGEGIAAVEITTAWAGRLRDLRVFTELQRAAGAAGQLETVDDSADAPRAVYGWTGAGGRGRMRAFLYRSGDFAAVVTPADGAGEIVLNNFGAFVCATCSPPVKACGRRPSWVPHSLHWDTFDCGCTLTGPQSLRGDRC